MIRDFSKTPEFLTRLTDDLTPQPWRLKSLGEILNFSYNLLEHPIFKKRTDYEDQFLKLSKDYPEYYKKFNRIIIERIVSEAEFYGKIKFEFGIVSMTSQGIENLLSKLKLILAVSNELNNATELELRSMGSSVILFQLTEEGHLNAIIKYFLNACRQLILDVRIKMWQFELKEIDSAQKRSKFLRRKKADLLQSLDSMDEIINTKLNDWIKVELDFIDETKEDINLAELKPIIEKFLTQQAARISSDELLRHLVHSEFDLFCSKLIEMVLRVFSFHDISGKEPEKVYHAFLIGILQRLAGQYTVRSNQEAGLGRFDLIIIPDSVYHDGVIIEVKKIKTNNQDKVLDALTTALLQIEEKKYSTEFKIQGVKKYAAIAAVFCGKELFMDWKSIEIR